MEGADSTETQESSQVASQVSDDAFIQQLMGPRGSSGCAVGSSHQGPAAAQLSFFRNEIRSWGGPYILSCSIGRVFSVE